MDLRLRAPRVLVARGSLRCVRASTSTVRIDSVGRTTRYGSSWTTTPGMSRTACSVKGCTGNGTYEGSAAAGHQGGRSPERVTRSIGTAAQRSAKLGANSGA